LVRTELAAVDGVGPGGEGQQRGLAGPRGAHDRGEPPAVDVHVDVVEGDDPGLPGPVRLHDLPRPCGNGRTPSSTPVPGNGHSRCHGKSPMSVSRCVRWCRRPPSCAGRPFVSLMVRRASVWRRGGVGRPGVQRSLLLRKTPPPLLGPAAPQRRKARLRTPPGPSRPPTERTLPEPSYGATPKGPPPSGGDRLGVASSAGRGPDC